MIEQSIYWKNVPLWRCPCIPIVDHPECMDYLKGAIFLDTDIGTVKSSVKEKGRKIMIWLIIYIYYILLIDYALQLRYKF